MNKIFNDHYFFTAIIQPQHPNLHYNIHLVLELYLYLTFYSSHQELVALTKTLHPEHPYHSYLLQFLLP